MSDILAENSRVVLVGAGNLATCLGVALVNVGIVPECVWSRTEKSASELALKLSCSFVTDISLLPDADIVIVAVRDDALPEMTGLLAKKYRKALLVHTAGSVSIDVWEKNGALRYGVFYPMQTFSKTKEVDFRRLGIFVEANGEGDLLLLEKLALSLTSNVYRADSEQRAFLHIGAVFACNFVNAMYRMSAELLEKHGLPFETMLPLIDETAAKLHNMHPAEAQTGPACRGDVEVMKRQREMLDTNFAEIYELLSRYIGNNAK